MVEGPARIGDCIDCMHASRGKAVVVTMTERRSRLRLLAHSLTARRTTSWVPSSVGWYFADPYSAWQRGSNENANGLTRQYLPRGLDFGTITDEQLRWVEHRLNTRPRKTLRFKTLLGVFTEELLNPVANQS